MLLGAVILHNIFKFDQVCVFSAYFAEIRVNISIYKIPLSSCVKSLDLSSLGPLESYSGIVLIQ